MQIIFSDWLFAYTNSISAAKAVGGTPDYTRLTTPVLVSINKNKRRAQAFSREDALNMDQRLPHESDNDRQDSFETIKNGLLTGLDRDEKSVLFWFSQGAD
jgi:hypothetical protein